MRNVDAPILWELQKLIVTHVRGGKDDATVSDRNAEIAYLMDGIVAAS